MATKSIAWNTGSGNINVEYGGNKDGTIVVTSDNNNLYESRSQQITVRTTDGSNIERTITIQQAAKVRIDISTAVVTASNQTYNGSAKTPTPTVTLNGVTVPSTGYDVAYSDNTNAGTATITVTGKNDYTGTAIGTFTIAKANSPITTEPVAKTGLVYNGTSQQLCTNGVASIAGTWNYPAAVNAVSTVQGTVYFIPNDTTNYNQYSKLITTSIAKASRTLSFADAYVVLNTSSNTTKTATPSAGSGDGAITYSISSTTYATINSSSGKVTAKTSDGSAIVTATIAEGTNYLSASTSYNLYVFATTHNYDYNGSYRSVTLPPGTYQFQCWGAQGGSNGTNSSYGITAQAGGKGGYSVGQLTVSQATGVRVYVGGAGSSTSGGYNGGGSTTGTSQYNASDELGYSKMGGGGGATDIRLSDGSLYSRMIVAGGGSGGAMGYKAVTTTTTTWNTELTGTSSQMEYNSSNQMYCLWNIKDQVTQTDSYFRFTATNVASVEWDDIQTNGQVNRSKTNGGTMYISFSGLAALRLWVKPSSSINNVTITVERQVTSSSTTTSTEGHTGYAGGGERSEAADTAWVATQTAAGTNASFGQGANQTATTWRYCGGAGGGGWYGGSGNEHSDTNIGYTWLSGGGSGWVNTSASAGNRPSGFSSLQLDSGTTYAGYTSFPAPGGGNETGHSGNGYARITRL